MTKAHFSLAKSGHFTNSECASRNGSGTILSPAIIFSSCLAVLQPFILFMYYPRSTGIWYRLKYNGVEKKSNQELISRIKKFKLKHRETFFFSLRIKTIEIRAKKYKFDRRIKKNDLLIQYQNLQIDFQK